MSDYERRAEWAKTRAVGRIWWCGDYFCDCTQAVIEKITPNDEVGFPWIHRERLWEGPFHSDSEPGAADDLAKARAEMVQRWPGVAACIEWDEQ